MLRLLLLLLVVALPLRAEVPGQGDPAFSAALESWLKGEDAAALPAFAALAREGNAAAQLFLGQVEAATHLHAPVTATLSRAERIALLRQPGGISGESWLKAAQDVPLARALYEVRQPETRLAAIGFLGDAGEIRAVLPAVTPEFRHGNAAPMIPMLTGPVFRPLAGFLARAALDEVEGYGPGMARPSAGQTSELRATLDATGEADLDRMIYAGYEPGQLNRVSRAEIDMVAGRLAAYPPLAPLTALCRRQCPEEPARCVLALINGGREGGAVLPWLSPVEGLLPTPVYQASPRFDADVLRQVALSATGPRMAAGASACISEKLVPAARAQ